ncbi:COX15/CtaA family protein [Corynebacterium diphtheriae]|uniref:COX15/CtaA family protein n=1 Tax=Corynebacterium diphtheriae TaxID=1717 RepID=UPI0018C91915|nr:heme A synthase [Corynebacterium diphtheriae bv. mitis]
MTTPDLRSHISQPRKFAPTISTQRRLAMALLYAQGGITITGSIVRVTGSGLGCNTWPNCHEGSLVPVQGAAPWIHQAIEFGNRLLTFVLVGIAISVFVAVYSTGRRKEIKINAWIQCLGIVVQAVIGGISVHLDLRWWAVAVHFLPSVFLVWMAAILYVRLAEPDDGEVVYPFAGSLRILAAFSAFLLSLVLVTGTMTTGAGVHSGDSGVGMEGRLDVDIDWMAHVHAWSMYVYLALTLLLVVGLALQMAPKRAQNVGWMLILMIIIQALIGVIQYRLGVPRWTVPVHIGMCSVVVAFCAFLWAEGKQRVSV